MSMLTRVLMASHSLPTPRELSLTLERWNRCFSAGISNRLSDEMASHLYELGTLVYGKACVDGLRASVKKAVSDER